MYLYSKSAPGFFVPEIHGQSIPGDAVEISDEQHRALIDGQSLGSVISSTEDGYPILIDPPEATLEQVQAAFTAAIQLRLDEFARTRNYDGILSACTYATSTVEKFQAEGQYAVESRDATWAAGYAILADVLSGERDMPTVEDVMSELPALAWPEA